MIIPIEKKQGAQECLQYITISLISHAYKTVLKTLRHGNKVEEFLGFRKACGTRDAIAC